MPRLDLRARRARAAADGGWRSRLSAVPTVALVFVAALGLYATTQGPRLVGYEPETAMVAEGLVRTGDFKFPPDPNATGISGKDGKTIGRAGLPQALLEAPFAALGVVLDHRSTNPDRRHWRSWTVLFYNPLVAAISAALFYLIALRLRRGRRWALALTAMFGAGSMAWPYAKFGMETTLMLAVLLTFYGTLRARESGRTVDWFLGGFAAGMAVAVKPYVLPAVLAAPLVLLPLRRASPKLLLALALPFVAWLVAMGWFNWLREGSVLATGNSPFAATFAAPFNLAGFFVSPGKGLLFYSPPVALGLLGFAALWRAERRIAAALLLSVGLLSVTLALTPYWTDETWGPRYLLPVAWLLLLPIPWFATTRRRRSLVLAVAILGVLVQVAAVTISPERSLQTLRRVTGLHVYEYSAFGAVRAPLGDDSARWIPQVSPLLLQSLTVASAAGQALGAGPITYSYRPHRGEARAVALTGQPDVSADLWWLEKGPRSLLVLIAALAGASAAGGLALRARAPSRGPMAG